VLGVTGRWAVELFEELCDPAVSLVVISEVEHDRRARCFFAVDESDGNVSIGG
jgi:hypothetical protein